MANRFDDQLARMKSLMTYGQVNEDKAPANNYSIEYRAKAADGKTYGIIRECNKYFIKCAPDGKETIAEAYNYIGGWANKKDYEYENYPKAYKQFELKMASINEACDAKINSDSLSPFIKQDLMTEASESMKNEIARQRQIMYNAGMIMNESKDYAVKGGEACHTDQPEAEDGKKGDEGGKDTKANPEYSGSKTSGVDKKAEPFKENPSNCKDQLKEELDTDFDEGMGKGRDPKSIGWDMENDKKVDANLDECGCCPNCGEKECKCNEELETDFDEGVPSSAGVGEADTDHNNDPFTKNVNEGFEDEPESDVEGGEEELPAEDGEEFSDEEETDFDAGLDDEFSDDNEEEDFDDDIDLDDEDFEDDEDFSDEEGVDESDPEAIRAEIDRLQSLLDNMEGGEEELPAEDGEEFGEEEFPEDEEGFEDEGDFADDDFEGEVDEMYPVDGDMEECGGLNPMMEAKQRKMNAIVESVVKKIVDEKKSGKKQRVNEDELHDFGKHPGYRKKPMQLPQTGEDKNQWGRDWNDESAHSEEPFGKQIGNGDPFTQLVNAVTKDVMYQLKKGVPIEGADKKKAE